MLKNPKLLHLLALTLIGMLLVLSALGLFAGYSLTVLSELTTKLYNHPFAVSNAVRDIRYDIVAMHRSMKDVLLARDAQDLEDAITTVDRHERHILSTFQLIRERFLGDLHQVEEARALFVDWKPIRDEVIASARDARQAEAAAITKDKSARHVRRLENHMASLLQFANDKAVEVHQSALQQRTQKLQMLFGILSLFFLSAIVVGGIIIRRVAPPIERLAQSIRRLAEGDFDVEIEGTRRGDEIGDIARATLILKDTSAGIANQAAMIAQGDFGTDIAPRSERDTLGIAMRNMTRKLCEAEQASRHNAWLQEGLTRLNEALHGERDEASLAQTVITVLCRYLEAPLGTLYLRRDADADGHPLEEPRLWRVGTYAYTGRKRLAKEFRWGESLVGQAALDGQPIRVGGVLADHLKIGSSLGESKPAEILLVPFQFQGKVCGVIEIGATRSMPESVLELLERGTEALGIAFEGARRRRELDRTRHDAEARNRLLEQAQSELSRHAEKLEQASRYKSEFLANMSHELRTPLNSLLILARSLAANEQGNLSDNEVESAQVIHDSGNHLLHLINDILDLSKIEAGRMDVFREPLVPRTLADCLRRRFAPMAEEKGIELVMALDETLPECVMIDARKLQQILTNLIGNAIKFTERGQVQVRFAVAADPDLLPGEDAPLTISVSDTGIGIPADKLSAVFEAFRQADGSTARTYGGTGLGLSIAQAITRLLGGRLAVHSEEGRGSTFSLYLPNRPTDKAHTLAPRLDSCPDEQAPPSEEKRGEEKRVILVVEEDETFAGILLAECRRRGLDVLAATDAETALGLLRDHPVAGILLDRMLPGMSGYEFLRRVKGDSNYRTIPVFIISALEDDGRGWLEGAVGYLTKPLDSDGIRAALARLAHFQGGQIRTLLVVEDEQPVRETITKQLQVEDVSVTAVPTAAAAHRALAGAEFDAMVLDLRLPDAQGIEVLERLGAERKINPPPVILYTAADLSAEQQQALRHYTHHVIHKNAHSLERLQEAVGLFLHTVKPAEVLGRSAGEASGAPSVDLSGRQVLIVDDDMRSTYALGKVLRDWGMEVHLAADAAKGLEILAREPGIDLVLMDVMMPEMDGNEATRRIRAQACFAELPIITLSAKAMEEDREASLAAGASAFVPKPIDTDALATTLGEWLHPVAAT